MAADPLQPAYVLHARRFRDSSLLLDLLTREQGRVSCVRRGALGARRPSASLQPFERLAVRLGGRGEVLSLLGVEPLGNSLHLSGRRLYCGLYVNELVLKLTGRQDPAPGLFDHYANTLAELAGGAPVEPVLRRFEVGLLDQLGFGLTLDQDSRGQRIDSALRYTFDAERGAVPASAAAADTVSGATLLALRSGRLDAAELLPEARQLMRRVLEHHLDGRVLRSRELFR